MGRKKKIELTDEAVIAENVTPAEAKNETTAEATVEPAKESKPRKPKKYAGSWKVTGVKSWLNIREDAGKDKKLVGKLLEGAVVECKGDSKKDADGEIWLNISVADDHGATFGYCMLNFLEKIDNM